MKMSKSATRLPRYLNFACTAHSYFLSAFVKREIDSSKNIFSLLNEIALNFFPLPRESLTYDSCCILNGAEQKEINTIS